MKRLWLLLCVASFWVWPPHHHHERLVCYLPEGCHHVKGTG